MFISSGNGNAKSFEVATSLESGSFVADRYSLAGHPVAERFRCPDDLIHLLVAEDLAGPTGCFWLGSDAVSLRRCSATAPAESAGETPLDFRQKGALGLATAEFPFDPVRLIEHLRFERYVADWPGAWRAIYRHRLLRAAYSMVRPALPFSARRLLQRLYFRGWENISFPKWPVDATVESTLKQILAVAMKAVGVDRVPFVWFWPEGALSCTIVTHDVETRSGRDHCSRLMDLNDSFGIKSSFQIVPEGRYAVPESVLAEMRERGFEVNIHDLNHDGRLMCERTEFLRRAQRINRYARQYGALGFRSAVMYRNLDWYDALDIAYDMSVPNVAHLDPQQGGCCTVFPFFAGKILELPVTTTQDYSLFHILRDYSIELWKEQMSLIRGENGLISFIIHPDYIIHEAAERVYTELLQHLAELRAQQETWLALPRDIAAWWQLRSRMSVTETGGAWRIVGAGSERAKLAYALLEGDTVRYELERN